MARSNPPTPSERIDESYERRFAPSQKVIDNARAALQRAQAAGRDDLVVKAKAELRRYGFEPMTRHT